MLCYHLLATLVLIVVTSAYIGQLVWALEAPLLCTCITVKGVWLMHGNVRTLHYRNSGQTPRNFNDQICQVNSSGDMRIGLVLEVLPERRLNAHLLLFCAFTR